MTSYDFLSLPMTSQDLLGPPWDPRIPLKSIKTKKIRQKSEEHLVLVGLLVAPLAGPGAPRQCGSAPPSRRAGRRPPSPCLARAPVEGLASSSSSPPPPREVLEFPRRNAQVRSPLEDLIERRRG